MSFSFNDLNLATVQTSGASSQLKPGRYVAKVTNALLRDTKSGGKMVEVELDDVGGNGNLRAFLNIHIPSSEQATRIGREQLKALLTFGGHVDPDNVGKHGIASLKGLKSGVLVVAESYTKDGEVRTGSKVKGFFDPKGFVSSIPASANPTPPSAGLDDEIPF
tara:strand:+ start:2614 stop:3102 length:489 start_codon:yes stop_codon:yes gene_type:complete